MHHGRVGFGLTYFLILRPFRLFRVFGRVGALKCERAGTLDHKFTTLNDPLLNISALIVCTVCPQTPNPRPSILNPQILNPQILNPQILNPQILNPESPYPESSNLHVRWYTPPMLRVPWSTSLPSPKPEILDRTVQVACYSVAGVHMFWTIGPVGDHGHIVGDFSSFEASMFTMIVTATGNR
jgi:hypothetical protein